MVAKRPETRSGSRIATVRGAGSVVAAAWLLGSAVTLLLHASDCARPVAAYADTTSTAHPAAPPAAAKPAHAVATHAESLSTAHPKPTTARAKPPAAVAPKPWSTSPTSAASSPGVNVAPMIAKPTAAAAPGSKSPPATPVSARKAAGAPAPAKTAPGMTANPGLKAVAPTPSPVRPATLPAVRSGPTAGPSGIPAPGRLGRPGSPGAGVQPVAHLEQRLTYQYNALGRRDPFQPLIGGEFVGADVGGDAPVDVGGMKVVGIVWGTDDKFAMVEDGRRQGMVLHVGDKVMNGVVESLRRDALVVKLTTDGLTQSVAIPLTRKGDKSNAGR